MAEVREYDKLRITGTTSDYRTGPPPGTIRVENLVGVVGSATFPAGEERSIKIWPEEDQPYNMSGKIWFKESETESIELLERDSGLERGT